MLCMVYTCILSWIIVVLFPFQTILTHSKSRVVLQVLKEAQQSNKRFHVYVTESLPNKSGSVYYLIQHYEQKFIKLEIVAFIDK